MAKKEVDISDAMIVLWSEDWGEDDKGFAMAARKTLASPFIPVSSIAARERDGIIGPESYSLEQIESFMRDRNGEVLKRFPKPTIGEQLAEKVGDAKAFTLTWTRVGPYESDGLHSRTFMRNTAKPSGWLSENGHRYNNLDEMGRVLNLGEDTAWWVKPLVPAPGPHQIVSLKKNRASIEYKDSKGRLHTQFLGSLALDGMLTEPNSDGKPMAMDMVRMYITETREEE